LMNGQSKVGKVSLDPRYTINQPTYELQNEAVLGATKFEAACKQFYYRHHKHIKTYTNSGFFNPWVAKEFMGLGLLGQSDSIHKHQRRIANICIEHIQRGITFDRVKNNDIILSPVHRGIESKNPNIIVTNRTIVPFFHDTSKMYGVMTPYISKPSNGKEFSDSDQYVEKLSNNNCRHYFTRLLAKWRNGMLSKHNCYRGVTVVASGGIEKSEAVWYSNSDLQTRYRFDSINHPRYSVPVNARTKVKMSVHLGSSFPNIIHDIDHVPLIRVAPVLYEDVKDTVVTRNVTPRTLSAEDFADRYDYERYLEDVREGELFGIDHNREW
jgi:hypothetical protein